MKAIQHHYRALGVGLIAIIILLVSGTVAYQHFEGWSTIDSMYFSASTLTTVGYGDIVPRTEAGKIFTIFYMFSGIGVVLIVLASFGSAYLQRIEKFSKREPRYKKSLFSRFKRKYRYRR